VFGEETLSAIFILLVTELLTSSKQHSPTLQPLDKCEFAEICEYSPISQLFSTEESVFTITPSAILVKQFITAFAPTKTLTPILQLSDTTALG